MIKLTLFVKLLEVLSRALRNPLLKDVDMEQAVLYCIDFIHIFGLPEMYLDKEEIVTIENYRGQLPCDLIAINLVKDTCSGICFRSMTDTFFPNSDGPHRSALGHPRYRNELTFKVQNHIIFTSIDKGEVLINYRATPVDENGFPLIPDDPVFQTTLELYIKVQVFTILFDLGKIKGDVLSHTELQYSWRAALLQSKYNTPSEAEMEALCRSWVTLIQRTTDFDDGWKNMSDREYLKRH